MSEKFVTRGIEVALTVPHVAECVYFKMAGCGKAEVLSREVFDAIFRPASEVPPPGDCVSVKRETLGGGNSSDEKKTFDAFLAKLSTDEADAPPSNSTLTKCEHCGWTEGLHRADCPATTERCDEQILRECIAYCQDHSQVAREHVENFMAVRFPPKTQRLDYDKIAETLGASRSVDCNTGEVTHHPPQSEVEAEADKLIRAFSGGEYNRTIVKESRWHKLAAYVIAERDAAVEKGRLGRIWSGMVLLRNALKRNGCSEDVVEFADRKIAEHARFTDAKPDDPVDGLIEQHAAELAKLKKDHAKAIADWQDRMRIAIEDAGKVRADHAKELSDAKVDALRQVRSRVHASGGHPSACRIIYEEIDKLIAQEGWAK